MLGKSLEAVEVPTHKGPSSKSCLKYFFRLDHSVDLIFYSSYYGKLACLIPSSCTFGPHKLFGFPNNKIDFVS